jgi:hypothetical protein
VLCELLLAAVLADAVTPPDPSDVVAVFRDGRITRAELEEWRAHRDRGQTTRSERALVEEIVLLRALGAQFDRQRLGDLRENAPGSGSRRGGRRAG